MAMNWHECAENPQAVTQLYDEVPELQGVDLMEVTLHQDGPRLEFRGDLSRFPDYPPARWVASGYNKAQLRLQFSSLNSIRIDGWGTLNLVDIHIERLEEERVILIAKGPICNIELICRFFWIAGVSGYMSTNGEEST